MSALRAYLEELHRIWGSGIATDERSYYPAPLDLTRLGKPSLAAADEVE